MKMSDYEFYKESFYKINQDDTPEEIEFIKRVLGRAQSKYKINFCKTHAAHDKLIENKKDHIYVRHNLWDNPWDSTNGFFKYEFNHVSHEVYEVIYSRILADPLYCRDDSDIDKAIEKSISEIRKISIEIYNRKRKEFIENERERLNINLPW